MRRFILLILAILPMSAMAQIPGIEKIVEEYSNLDNVVAMNINESMLGMFLDVEDDTFDEVDNIQIVLSEDPTIGKEIIGKANKVIKSIKAETMINVNEENRAIAIYTKKSGDIITDIILTIEEEQSGVIAIACQVPEDRLDELVQVPMNL